MKLLLSLILFSLVGCRDSGRMTLLMTGFMYERCVDGIVYIQFASGASVKYDKDGKPEQCEKKKQTYPEGMI